MKKIEIWYCVKSSDGYGSVSWFLTEEHAEKYNDSLSEQLSDNIYSAETFEGSDIHNEAIENSKELEGKHEYLKEEDYYERNEVGTKARRDKICEYCGKTIKIGTPHHVHKFYPEFASYPTHKQCSEKFKKSLN